MTPVPAAPAKNIKNAAAWSKALCRAAGDGRKHLIQPFLCLCYADWERVWVLNSLKGLRTMIEYDQYRLDLQAMKDVILELRDSL